MSGSQGGVIAVVVVLAGVAGMAVGRWIAERRLVEVSHVPVAAWQRGDAFPDFFLVTESGDSVSTGALLARGGVVLFLAPECPPCVDMARKWDRAVRDGVVPGEQVVVITGESAGAISHLQRAAGLQIAIYRDPGRSVLANGWVSIFPVEVIVADNGSVAAVSGNPAAPLDRAILQAALAGGN